MNPPNLGERITQKRIVPVAVIEAVEYAVPLARALAEGGLPLIEVTLRTSCALECIREIRRACPEMMVGAGTVLEPQQLADAIEAGAQFGVSPGLNENIVRAARDKNFFFIPGIMTPSEIESALQLGCKLLKFFPADAAGGVKMLKALAGPYEPAGARFIPLGGVSAANMQEYLALPNVAAIGGSWLCERKLMREQQWDQITLLAREALAKAQV
jgi:2-dehydro-3-deoxyphosphogluconate aldolase/(4S)-4-hydroxy-2-oxoglutarate aldolase